MDFFLPHAHNWRAPSHKLSSDVRGLWSSSVQMFQPYQLMVPLVLVTVPTNRKNILEMLNYVWSFSSIMFLLVCLCVSSVTISLHLLLVGKLKFAVSHRLALGKQKSYAKISITMQRMLSEILKLLQRYCKEARETVISMLFLALFYILKPVCSLSMLISLGA